MLYLRGSRGCVGTAGAGGSGGGVPPPSVAISAILEIKCWFAVGASGPNGAVKNLRSNSSPVASLTRSSSMSCCLLNSCWACMLASRFAWNGLSTRIVAAGGAAAGCPASLEYWS